MVPIDTHAHANSSSIGTALVLQQDEGENWNFRFDSDAGRQDKACIAELREDAESSEEGKNLQEDLSGSESETSSDSDTCSYSTSESEEQTVQFALMANTSLATESNQVVNECSSSHSKCFGCVDMESKVLAYQTHNEALICDLSLCIDANKVLKSNEKDFQAKIELLNRQLHEAEIAVLNKQDAITSYLNTINEIKKKLAIVECDYETLAQKLKSYESSYYIIEHMISKGTDQREKGTENYKNCPPPILNSFVNSPDDKDVKDFQVKTPLKIKSPETSVAKTSDKTTSDDKDDGDGDEQEGSGSGSSGSSGGDDNGDDQDPPPPPPPENRSKKKHDKGAKAPTPPPAQTEEPQAIEEVQAVPLRRQLDETLTMILDAQGIIQNSVSYDKEEGEIIHYLTKKQIAELFRLNPDEVIVDETSAPSFDEPFPEIFDDVEEVILEDITEEESLGAKLHDDYGQELGGEPNTRPISK
ncbi:hypothetical protein R6Q57_019498 [Mikania cordata]